MSLFSTRRQEPYEEIDAVKNQIINYSLIIGSILGLFAFLSSLENYINNYNIIFFILDLSVVATFIFMAIIRNRVRIKIKATIVIIALFILILVDQVKLGAYSDNKILIVLIPFIAFLGFSFRTTLILYAVAISSFIFLGYLYISGIIVTNIDFLERSKDIEPLIVNVLLISIVSLVVVMVIRKFNYTFLDLIANLKNKNREIAENERNYREIFNSTTDAIFIHGMDGSIIDVNKAMLEMYGYKADEITSIRIADLSSGIAPYDNENAGAFVQKAIQEGVQIFDWQARKKTGELFWTEVALKKSNIGGKERVIAVVRDIDEKKQTAIQLNNYRDHLELMVKERTEELESANEELISGNEELYAKREQLELTLNKLRNTQENLIQSEKMASLGILASGVAHEINNPLNFIQGGVNGIEIYLEDNLNKKHLTKIAPFIDGIKEGVQRTSNIVTSLNHFSRTDNLTTEKCNIHTIIDNCLTMLNNKLKHKIEVRKKYTESSIDFKCNDGKLHQVILNILSNAEQAIEQKGVIEITTFIDQQNLKITITDTGSGIKEDIISKISDPFFTTKEVGKGTGLGLSIAYKIVKESNGTIKHISKEGEGTEVIITLPISN